jgi:hypothetical protein
VAHRSDELLSGPTQVVPVVFEEGHDNGLDVIAIAARPGGNEALVAWHDYNYGAEIYAARLNMNGEPLDPLPFQVSDLSEGAAGPDVATDGQRYLVVWADCEHHDVRGRFVDPGGTADPELVWPGDPSCYRPSVVAGNGTFLVSWPDPSMDAGILLDADGGVVATLSGAMPPITAFNGTDFFAADFTVWRIAANGTIIDAGSPLNPASTVAEVRLASGSAAGRVLAVYSPSASSQILAARIDPNGVVLDDPSLAVGPNFFGAPPAAVIDDDTAVICWPGPGGLTTRRLSMSTGALLDAAPVVLEGSYYGFCDVAARGGHAWLAAERSDFRLRTFTLELDGGAARAATTPAYRLFPWLGDQRLALVGDRVWFTWTETLSDAGRPTFATVLDLDGGVLASGLPLPHDPGEGAPVALFSGGVGFMCTQPSSGGVHVQGFDPATRSPVFDRFFPGFSSTAALSVGPAGLEVPWLDAGSVWLTHVDTDGGIRARPVDQNTDGGIRNAVGVAACGTAVLTWWSDFAPNLELVRENADGGLVQFNFPQLYGVDVACGPEVMLLTAFGSTDVRLGLLRDGDNTLELFDAGEAVLTTGRAAFDGRSFWVLHTVVDSSTAVGDLWLTEISLDGGLASRIVASEKGLSVAHSAVSPGGGRTWFAWDQFIPLPDAGNFVPVVGVWVQAPDGTPCAQSAECLSGACVSGLCCGDCDAGTAVDAGVDAGFDAGAISPPVDAGGPELARTARVGCGCASSPSFAMLIASLALLRRARLRRTLTGIGLSRASRRRPRHATW